MTRAERDALRRAFGDYVRSEGCACCRNNEAHEDAAKRLAALLRVPQFKDASGYDFWRYTTSREA